MDTATSYLSRAQQWLDDDDSVTIESLEQTIEKFSRQLREGAVDADRQKDLQDTLDLLNNYLVEQLGPDVEPSDHKTATKAEPDGEVALPSELDGLIDFSPLVPPDDTATEVLSDAEKAQRLSSLLASGKVTRGVST